jgi:DUF971 family protein
MTVRPFVPDTVDLQPQRLLLRWPDGDAALGAATLRTACRCAGCRAAALNGYPHVPDAGIRLTDAVPIGRYALQLVFSDGHERGIYPWPLLRELSLPRVAQVPGA